MDNRSRNDIERPGATRSEQPVIDLTAGGESQGIELLDSTTDPAVTPVVVNTAAPTIQPNGLIFWGLAAGLTILGFTLLSPRRASRKKNGGRK